MAEPDVIAALVAALAGDAATTALVGDAIFGGELPEGIAAVRSTAARRLWSIERETHAGTLVHWVNRAGGFSQARDRDGQWPQSFQSFQVFYSLQEVQ